MKKREQLKNNITFKAIDKNPRVTKIVNKMTVSKNVIEKELEIRQKPNIYTYSPDDRNIKTRLPLYTVPRGRRGDRTPSPDR